MRQNDVTTPHFAVPLTLLPSGTVKMNEQNSEDEIIDGIKVLLSFPVGSRVELPAFGVNDVSFREITQDVVDTLRQTIARWDTRAEIIFEDDLAGAEELVRRIIIKIKGPGNVTS